MAKTTSPTELKAIKALLPLIDDNRLCEVLEFIVSVIPSLEKSTTNGQKTT